MVEEMDTNSWVYVLAEYMIYSQLFYQVISVPWMGTVFALGQVWPHIKKNPIGLIRSQLECVTDFRFKPRTRSEV